MSRTSLSDLLLHVRKCLALEQARDVSDADLLKSFLTSRDDTAFAVLVHRHGPMVLSVCERVLGDAHAAEDAFQATFMVLVRRAGSIRKSAPLANWLYGVAQRIANKAKVQNARRLKREMRAQPMADDARVDELSWQEMKSVLDEEIARLPNKYRAPIVLCYLEGMTHDRAARQIGCAKSSLTNRLERARELLRRGLEGRGLALSAAGISVVLAEKARAMTVATKLAISTVKAATALAAGQTLAQTGLSAGAVTLAEQAMKSIFWTKVKVLLAVAITSLAAGGAGFALNVSPGGLEEGTEQEPGIGQASNGEGEGKAEKLFRELEKKVREAKSLKVIWEFEDTDITANGPETEKASGTYLFGENNTCRLEGEVTIHVDTGPSVRKLQVVSDGAQMFVRDIYAQEERIERTPKELGAYLRAYLARQGGEGLGFETFDGRRGFRFNADNIAGEVAASNFRLGATERVGTVDAQVVEFKRTFGTDKKVDAKFKIWIDLKTMTPLKRQRQIGKSGEVGSGVITETYKEFSLETKFDDKVFELPLLNQSEMKALPAKSPGSAAGLLDTYGDAMPAGAVARLGTIRFRHDGLARAFAFSSDGKWLAAGCSNGSFGVHIWEAATGKPLHQLLNGECDSLTFSPDNKLLLAAAKPWNNPHLVVIDVATGKELRKLLLPEGERTQWHAALSPDGKTAAAAEDFWWLSEEKVHKRPARIVFWDITTGKQTRTFIAHDGGIRSIVYLKDGKKLISASEDDSIRLWDAASGTEMRRFQGKSVIVAPDEMVLAVLDEGPAVRLLDCATGEELRRLQADGEKVRVVTFSPDGKILAVGGASGIIRLWDTARGKEIRHWAADIGGGTDSVAFSPDGKILVSGGWLQSQVHQWDVATGKEIDPYVGHGAYVHAMAYSADGKSLLTSGAEAHVFRWSLANGQRSRFLFGQSPSPDNKERLPLAFSADGRLVVYTVGLPKLSIGASAWDPVIHLWDTAANKELHELKGHSQGAQLYRFSPDNKLLVSAAADGVRLWDTGTGKELPPLMGNQLECSALDMSADGKLLLSGGNDKTLRLWDLVTRKELRHWDWDNGRDIWGQSAILSADGKFVVYTIRNVSGLPQVHVCDTATSEEKFSFGPVQYHALALSTSSRLLAYAHSDGIHIWDMLSGKEIRQIATELGNLPKLAFAPDGRSLASTGMDSTVLLWDLTGHGNAPKGQSPPLADSDLASLWSDLAGDAAKAERAIWALALAPQQSLPLLNQRLRPPPAGDAEQVAKLIADLASDQPQARQKASEELDKLSEAAEGALRKAISGNPSLEFRRRVDLLLEKRDKEVVQRLRAIETVEYIGTSEARRLLEAIGQGSPNPRLAAAASAAVQRLARRALTNLQGDGRRKT